MREIANDVMEKMGPGSMKYSEAVTHVNTVQEIIEQKQKAEKAKSTESWLTITPTIINGLSLSKGEFRDGMSLRYGFEFNELPKRCDGCGAKFTIGHALSCKKGGLVVG